MMKKISKKYLIGIIIGVVLIVGVILALVIRTSHAEILENDVEVEPNSDLTYYLKVKYDGVDREGVESSDSVTSNVNSGTITVTDKIPDGLTFTGFVTTSDGSIGAVKRSDGTTSCSGRVVDDTNESSTSEGSWNTGHTEYTYHGLHYNANTRTVSFKVKNLKAGCMLTVGIITKTPATVDDPNTQVVETRRDFYNFGNAAEGSLSVNSNTVHAYMGNEATTYNVVYQYTGTVPEGAPSVPGTNSYSEGASVGVAANPTLEGYTFSGWSTNDATISNGSFTMPNNEVVLKGSFTKKTTYDVQYVISGTSPEGYVPPSNKSYSEGEVVTLDSLKAGDVFNGYKFLGWTTEDVTISEDRDFEMPNKAVTLTGRWEQIKYKVTYKFYNTVLPPNSSSLLPAEASYVPGTTVTLANNPEASGYKFLGWYKENNFTMPEEDITIYGEWQQVTGTFEPTITKTIENEKETYKAGDEIRFKIRVSNTASFAISDVIVKEDIATFINGTGYTVSSDHFATIASIPANSSVDVYAKYTVKDTDIDKVKNTAEIKGTLAANNYVLKDKEYKAEKEFKIQSVIKINKKVTGNMGDINEYFKVKVIINGTNGDTYTISGQSYTGTGVQTTYTVGQDSYIFLKDGETITIGKDGDKQIKPGTTYRIIEDDNNYYSYINGSSTNNKDSGNITVSDSDIENTVAINNSSDRAPQTGNIFKFAPYIIIIALVIAGAVFYVIGNMKRKEA